MNKKTQTYLGIGALAVAGYILYNNYQRKMMVERELANKPSSPVASYVGGGIQEAVGDRNMFNLTDELNVQESDWVRFTQSATEMNTGQSDWVRADGQFFDVQSSQWVRLNGAPASFFQTQSTNW